MSQLIQLSDGCWVDSAHVAEVKVNPLANTITVRMKDGIGHSIGNDYGLSIYHTAKRLIAEINDARTK